MAIDLNLPLEVRVMPTVREADGLAMSSRNALLTPAHRQAAPAIRRALLELDATFAGGETAAGGLEERLRRKLAAIPGARIDYAEVRDPSRSNAARRPRGPVTWSRSRSSWEMFG